MKPPRASQQCPCGRERPEGKPLCNRHMAQASEQLVTRYFNRLRRLRRSPSEEAAALVAETARELVAEAESKGLR